MQTHDWSTSYENVVRTGSTDSAVPEFSPSLVGSSRIYSQVILFPSIFSVAAPSSTQATLYIYIYILRCHAVAVGTDRPSADETCRPPKTGYVKHAEGIPAEMGTNTSVEGRFHPEVVSNMFYDKADLWRHILNSHVEVLLTTIGERLYALLELGGHEWTPRGICQVQDARAFSG